MSDSGFIAAIVFLMILGGLGSIAWWVFVIWLGSKVWRAAASQLDGLLPQIEAQLRTYQYLPPSQRAGQDAQIAAMMFKLNQGMRQIDSVHRARYEARVGEISSMAAQAGIDFTPSPW
jgi:hypothetical protein